MKILVSALAAVALVAGTADSAPGPAAPPFKCAAGTPVLFPDAPEHLLLIDGKVREEARLRDLDPEAIESVSVICANDVYESFGVKTRLGATVVFTRPGPHSALKATLASIAALQEAHLERHGEFATKLSQLPWSDPSGLVTVELVVSDADQWQAIATHRHLAGSRSPSLSLSGERPAP